MAGPALEAQTTLTSHASQEYLWTGIICHSIYKEDRLTNQVAVVPHQDLTITAKEAHSEANDQNKRLTKFSRIWKLQMYIVPKLQTFFRNLLTFTSSFGENTH